MQHGERMDSHLDLTRVRNAQGGSYTDTDLHSQEQRRPPFLFLPALHHARLPSCCIVMAPLLDILMRLREPPAIKSKREGDWAGCGLFSAGP